MDKTERKTNQLQSLFHIVFQRRWAARLGLVGATVLLLFSFAGEKAEERETVPPAAQSSASHYEKALEKRLHDLIVQVEGAGEAQVMVLLEHAEQTVYAQSRQESGGQTQADSGSTSQYTARNDYVLVNGRGGAQPLPEMTLQPVVKGVAVVCSGADDVRVVSRVTALISTVLGIPSNRICVTK